MSLATLKRKSNAKKRVSASGKTGNTFNIYGKRSSHVSQIQSCKPIETLFSIEYNRPSDRITLPICKRNTFHPQQSYKTRLNRLKPRKDLNRDLMNYYRGLLVRASRDGGWIKNMELQGYGAARFYGGGYAERYGGSFHYIPEGANSSSERMNFLKSEHLALSTACDFKLMTNGGVCRFPNKHYLHRGEFLNRGEYLKNNNLFSGSVSVSAKTNDGDIGLLEIANS